MKKHQDNSPAGLPISVRLAAIIGLVIAAALAFAYAGGWLTPARLTPAKIVDSLAPAGGAIKGYRRNHAKGICFAGSFEANGEAVAISRAPLFKVGTYPVTGRFNLAGPIPTMSDGAGRVRGLSLRIQAPDGQEWRTAMINPPFFPVATPADFYALQRANANKQDPAPAKQFAASHPALRAFGAWASTAPYAESYAQDRFNSLNSFVFTNAQGQDQVARWSFIPTTAMVSVPPEDLKKRDPDFLFQDITERTAAAPQKWKLVLTLANPGDPTADPTQVWPDDRRQIDAGMLVVTRTVPEADGPCRDINFDPTVLPKGIRTSDDPFPAARSAAYALSYDRRTAESDHYPRIQSEGKP